MKLLPMLKLSGRCQAESFFQEAIKKGLNSVFFMCTHVAPDSHLVKL